MAGGPLVARLVAGLENAAVAGGLSAIIAGLYSIGKPKNSIVIYETGIKAGQVPGGSSWKFRLGG